MLTNDVLQLCILGDNRRSHKVIKALKDRFAICRRSLFFVLSDDILVLNRRQLPACVQANLRCFTVGGNVGDELNGFISNLRIFGNDVTVGEEVRSLLSVTRFNNDIPIEVAIARIFGECPNTRHNHAKAARLKQVPVTHACHLLLGGHNIGFLLHVNHVLQRFNIFRGIHRELRKVIIEKAAAVLLNGFIELVEGNGMIIAKDIITQRTDFLRRSHCILPLPVIRGIVDTGLIKQILVVNQHNIREAIRNAILYAVSAERFQGHIVVDRGVDAVFGQDVIQRH